MQSQCGREGAYCVSGFQRSASPGRIAWLGLAAGCVLLIGGAAAAVQPRPVSQPSPVTMVQPTTITAEAIPDFYRPDRPAPTATVARPRRLARAIERTVPAFTVEQSDLGCLTAAIYYEAASEPDEGQVAVGQVVINRTRQAGYPKSVCGVVYQGSARRTGCQFTFTCDGSLYRTPSRAGWARAEAAARRVLGGTETSSVGTATHYHASYVSPYWAPGLTRLGQIGAHIFYRGGARAPGRFLSLGLGREPRPKRPSSSSKVRPRQAPVFSPWGLEIGRPAV